MSAPLKIKWLLLVIALFVCAGFAQESDLFDEDSPEVTARVARISFIRGEVQVKRSGEQDWESVTLNLPLVEGDEIATSANARVEIQFDSQNFLRLAENSYLKITTLRDEGIAVSLTEGLLSLRVFKFEKEGGFFEIDAPSTTISVQNAGLFRIDARNQAEVRAIVTEGGQARIYSDSAGFTLRDGRSATVFLSNDRMGEWETNSATGLSDEWDTWVAERDAKVSLLLNNSFYDKYYDRDMYGAEELNNYGSWSDSDEYGKIWRPHNSSISGYDNWSPYRYGHWRWVNPFGWTWINDESWGWATYHHGRWINDNRGWFWTPYPQHRPKKSWWRPAVVFIFNVGNDVCWYPLTHRDRYYDYNRRFRQNNGRWNNDRNYGSRDFRRLPENSIIAVRQDEFGRRRHNPRSIPNDFARRGWENNRNETANLPRREERRDDFRREMRRPNLPDQNRIGVIQRQPGVQLDPQLRNERFRRQRQTENPNNNGQFSRENNDIQRNERRNREPNNQNQPPVANSTENNSERPQRPPRTEEQRPIINVPTPNNSEETNGRERNRRNNPIENNQPQPNNSEENNRQRRRERDDENDNRNVRRDNQTENRPVSPNRSEQPRREESRREEPRREEPRREERREQPRQEQRREEPRREQPRQDPPRVERKPEERRPEPPRPKETPREERRSAPPPKSDNKPDAPIIDIVEN